MHQCTLCPQLRFQCFKEYTNTQRKKEWRWERRILGGGGQGTGAGAAGSGREWGRRPVEGGLGRELERPIFSGFFCSAGWEV